MGRYCGPNCRLCRAEGEKLFLKGERCYGPKCAVERREGSAPGQHGKSRGKFTEYKTQLREKQKMKRMYGLLEKQFSNDFMKAARSKNVTGTELLLRMERRLDNMVYRIGFSTSRRQGRQAVRHGLVLVNGKKCDIPSYQVSVGDVVEIHPQSKGNITIKSSMELAQSRSVPEWLTLDKEGVKGTIKALPTRDQLTHPIKEQLIVELYSK